MAITSIKRDMNNNVSIVRVISSDSLATVSTAGYIAAQQANINALNDGPWTWFSTDMVLVAASDQNALLTFTNSTFSSLAQYGGGGGGSVTSSEVQQQAFNTSADTGAANSYVGAISPVPVTLTQSLPVLLTIGNTNTGASTFNLNALGVNPIVNLDGSALSGGELVVGNDAFLMWNVANTQWVLLNSALSNGTFNFATKAQVQKSQFNIGVDTGIADAYVVALTPASASLTEGLIVEFIPLHTNLTTTPTVNVDGHGVIGIALLNADAVIAADVRSGVNTILQFDSNANLFFLQNPQLSYTTARKVQTLGYNAAADGGSVNAYSMSINPAPPGTLTNAFPVWVTNILNTNTGAATFALNGGSTRAIVNLVGSALTGGELVLHNDAHLVYNLTNNNWVLQNSALSGGGSGVTPTQVQQNSFNEATDSGIVNAYIGAYTPAVTGFGGLDGVTFVLNTVNFTNTGATTFDNGAGAKPVVTPDLNALVGGEIVLNNTYQFMYNPFIDSCVLLNSSLASGGGGSADTILCKSNGAQTIANGAATIITGMDFTPVANKTYLLRGYIAVNAVDTTSQIANGITNTGISSGRTISLVSGWNKIFVSANTISCATYNNIAQGINQVGASLTAPGDTNQRMLEIYMVFTTIDTNTIQLFMNASTATGSTIQNNSCLIYTLLD